MPGKTIDLTLNNGFAGSYARHPEMLVNTRPNESTENITFGRPLMRSTTPAGGVVPVDATFTAALFEGVAGKEVKSVFTYLDQNAGGAYAPKEAVSVFQKGSINVLCSNGSPVPNGEVYVRIVENGLNLVGDFEAVSVSGENILLPNCQWGGPADSRNVAELVILYRVNA